MSQLEDLIAGAVVTGVDPVAPVTFVSAQWHRTRAVTLVCRDRAGQVDDRLLFRSDEDAPSRGDTLPHQIEAVYGTMLPRSRCGSCYPTNLVPAKPSWRAQIKEPMIRDRTPSAAPVHQGRGTGGT